jgi:hypothetical protein
LQLNTYLPKVPFLGIKEFLVLLVVKMWEENGINSVERVAYDMFNRLKIHRCKTCLSHRAGIMLGVCAERGVVNKVPSIQ